MSPEHGNLRTAGRVPDAHGLVVRCADHATSVGRVRGRVDRTTVSPQHQAFPLIGDGVFERIFGRAHEGPIRVRDTLGERLECEAFSELRIALVDRVSRETREEARLGNERIVSGPRG